MAQQLRTLTAFAKGLALIPSTHMAASSQAFCNLDPTPSSGLQSQAYTLSKGLTSI